MLIYYYHFYDEKMGPNVTAFLAQGQKFSPASCMSPQCPQPAWGPHLLSAEPKVTGYHPAVLEATGQVIDDVLVVQPVVLIQVLLEGLVPCTGVGGGVRLLRGTQARAPLGPGPYRG